MTTQNNSVSIKYNGQDFTGIFGNAPANSKITKQPLPLVSVNTTAQKDANNDILLLTHSINLEGVAFSTGISEVVAAYSGIVKFFQEKEKQGTVFEISCSAGLPAAFLQYSGTSFVSANADKSSNNWIHTIPYTIVLESVETGPGQKYPIESYEDSWTIEPLEDISYFNIQNSSQGMGESIVNSAGASHTVPSSTSLSFKDFKSTAISTIQYRITHRINAIGKAQKTGNPNNPAAGGNALTNNQKTEAYINAANWVMYRLTNAIKTNNAGNTSPNNQPTGISLIMADPVANSSSNSSFPIGLHLFNHIRTIESSPGAGSYGVTDTWLALGTGTPYVEDFTWEVSLDEKWIHNVTLNGTIRGLQTSNSSGLSLLIEPAATGSIRGPSSAGTPSLIQPDLKTNTKYKNALHAYTSGIKPFFYHRATHAINMSKNLGGSSLTTNNSHSTYFSPNNTLTTYISVPRPLNIVPASFNENFNPVAGTITYNITYNDRPACLLSGALDATMSVTDTNPTDIVAEAFVLGRPLGPILEKVGTTKTERQFSIEAIYPVPTGFDGLHPQSPKCPIYHRADGEGAGYKSILNLVDAMKPVGTKAFDSLLNQPSTPYYYSTEGQIFKTADTETWNPFEGRYSRNITWIYNTGICT